MKKRRQNSKRNSRRILKAKATLKRIDEWFAELDRFINVPFMEDGRHQPPMPEPDNLSD